MMLFVRLLENSLVLAKMKCEWVKGVNANITDQWKIWVCFQIL